MMDMREYMERQRRKRSMKKEAENQDTENQVTGNRKRDISEAAGKKKIWENRKGRNENSKNWMHWMDKKRKRLNLCISLGICIMLILFQRGLTVQGQGLSEPTEKIAEETEGLGEGEEQEVSGRPDVSLKESELYARSAVLMDGDSGRILFDKNGEEVLPMASTTKIMTCILALELSDPEDLCQVSDLAAAQPKVHLGMRSGESYRMEDLLYSMMLESHNDSAVCVAEHVGGSVEGFARLMNRKAEEIGCTDTHYVTPNGLDGEDEGGVHATTAADLARVLRYCVTQSEQREKFCEITGTAQWSFTDVSGTRSFTAVNHNTLFQLTDGVISGKTGFTGNAAVIKVVQIGIVAAWAYMESVLDVRALLVGDKIALIKSSGQWTTQLGKFLTVFESGSKAIDCTNGLSYQDYLKGFLLLEKEKTLAFRMMNVMEQTVRQNTGQEYFRMDHAICRLDYDVTYQAAPLFSRLSVLGKKLQQFQLKSNAQFSYY